MSLRFAANWSRFIHNVPRFLQDCQTHQNLRAETGLDDTAVREKIHGAVENL